MKIVIAPDKFKNSLNAFEFCNAVEEGFLKVSDSFEIVKLPLADGGDGTMTVIKHYLEGEEVKITVKDPLFRNIEASYLFSSKHKSAFIEMAEASGYHLLKPEDRNCMNTSTYGTGEMIKNAIENGVKEIILGIGGSATNDCGIGMATALGYRFLDKNGNDIIPIGRNLIDIISIDASQVHPQLKNINFKVACDVTNPLYGPKGAAHVYASQKGANKEEVIFLDKGLRHFATVLNDFFGVESGSIIGGGAAGGMGAGGKLFLDAMLIRGIEMVMEIASFKENTTDADWIITGEGKLDNQTVFGKTISGILQFADDHKIPVAAFCGSVVISIDEQKQLGIEYATSILKKIGSLEDAIDASYGNLRFQAYNFANMLIKK